MLTLLASAIIIALPPDCYGYDIDPTIQMELTDQERNRMWNEIHFCIKKMNGCLDNADREAAKITKVDIEQATRAAIAGAVTGIATKSAYGVVISTCLNTFGTIAGDSYAAFKRSRSYVKDAQYYAERADELQEALWRDE